MEPHEELFEPKKPRGRWWLRWLKRIGKGLLMATIILAVRQCWHHYQATKKLEETLAEIDRAEPNWRLEDIEAAREEVPEDENSASVVVAAVHSLPKDWPSPEFQELFVHLPPEEQLALDKFARLKTELDKVQPALEKARKLAEMPRGRHPITYKRNPIDTLLPGRQETRRVVALLGYDAWRHDQDRDLRAALTSCRASFNAARSLGDEPIHISQLIRLACVINTCHALERLLAQGEPPPDELGLMRQMLRDEDAFPEYLIAARGSRAMLHGMFDAIESSDVPFSQLAGSKAKWTDPIFGWFNREKIREAHPTMLALMSRDLTIARLPMHEQAVAEGELVSEIRALKKTDPLAVIFIPAFQRVADACRRKHAYLRCMTVALAAERYRRANKNWPKTIDNLCPKYLSAVPLDPFDGRPLRYRRIDDGVVIYSVGNDGVDDGGNFDPAHPNQLGVDIGYRLWDVAKRRQPPRPKPPAAVPPALMPGLIPNIE